MSDLSSLIKAVVSGGRDKAVQCAMEAVTPAPQTRVPMKEFREQFGGNVTIWGGIPSILFEPMYRDKDFDDFIKNMFKEMAPGSRFIVGMGDNLPFDGSIDRVGRVAELIDKYGKLPIKL